MQALLLALVLGYSHACVYCQALDVTPGTCVRNARYVGPMHPSTRRPPSMTPVFNAAPAR